MIYVDEGNDAATLGAFVGNLRAHHGKPTQIESASIDMWPAFIRGMEEQFLIAGKLDFSRLNPYVFQPT